MAGIAFCAFSCNRTAPNDDTALKGIIEQLKSDSNHTYMRSLIPTLEDCEMVFIAESAEKVFNYSESRFSELDKLPDNAMKPVTEGATVETQMATKKELEAGTTNDLEEAYSSMAKYLKEGQKVFGFHYLNTEGEVEKSRAAFFKAGDKWIFIPRPFMALE